MINDIGNLLKSEKINTLNLECFKISELCVKQRKKIIITQWQLKVCSTIVKLSMRLMLIDLQLTILNLKITLKFKSCTLKVITDWIYSKSSTSFERCDKLERTDDVWKIQLFLKITFDIPKILANNMKFIKRVKPFKFLLNSPFYKLCRKYVKKKKINDSVLLNL